MLRAIIIEDKEANIETLMQLLQQFCPSVHVIATATNVESGYLLISQQRPDVVFLDIELDNASGFDLLHMFRDVFFKTIFTTAYSRYAIDALRAQALDYLLKPISIRQLQEAVLKVEEGLKQEENDRSRNERLIPQAKISLPTQEGFLFIHYNEILRCEGAGSYSNFFLLDGKKIMVSLRLKECEDLLPATVFFRVHKSHIINVNHVIRYARGRIGQVFMPANTVVEVSASHKDEFLNFMKRKWK